MIIATYLLLPGLVSLIPKQLCTASDNLILVATCAAISRLLQVILMRAIFHVLIVWNEFLIPNISHLYS